MRENGDEVKEKKRGVRLIGERMGGTHVAELEDEPESGSPVQEF
ncbi:MAG TPA: hypothetical protein PLX30_12250 [Methanothrix sp.]|nr:hypothetical protein [Methanothrix sp.]